MRIKFIDQDAREGQRTYYFDLPGCPRKGDFIDLGDGVRRHVEAVVWLRERGESELGEGEEFAHDVRIDLRMGIPS